MSTLAGVVTAGNSWATEVDGSLIITRTKLVQAATPSVAVPLTAQIQAEDLQDNSVPQRAIQSQAISVDKMDTGAAAYMEKLSLTDQNNNNSTGQMTIQVQDANGTTISARRLCRVWISTTDMGATVAATSFAATTGTAIVTSTANGNFLVLTNASGQIVMAISGAGTWYVMAEVGGRVYSARVIITTT